MCETRRRVAAKILETVVFGRFRPDRVPRSGGVKLRVRARPRSSRPESCSERSTRPTSSRRVWVRDPRRAQPQGVRARGRGSVGPDVPLPTAEDGGSRDQREGHDKASEHVGQPHGFLQGGDGVCGGTPFDRHPRCANAPLSGGSRRDRKLEAERRAFARHRLDPDLTVHCVDQLAADVEPEPRAAHALRHVSDRGGRTSRRSAPAGREESPGLRRAR